MAFIGFAMYQVLNSNSSQISISLEVEDVVITLRAKRGHDYLPSHMHSSLYIIICIDIYNSFRKYVVVTFFHSTYDLTLVIRGLLSIT